MERGTAQFGSCVKVAPWTQTHSLQHPHLSSARLGGWCVLTLESVACERGRAPRLCRSHVLSSDTGVGAAAGCHSQRGVVGGGQQQLDDTPARSLFLPVVRPFLAHPLDWTTRNTMFPRPFLPRTCFFRLFRRSLHAPVVGEGTRTMKREGKGGVWPGVRTRQHLRCHVVHGSIATGSSPAVRSFDHRHSNCRPPPPANRRLSPIWVLASHTAPHRTRRLRRRWRRHQCPGRVLRPPL